MTNNTAIYIRLPLELRARLKLAAQERGVGQSAIVRAALEDFLAGGSSDPVVVVKDEVVPVPVDSGPIWVQDSVTAKKMAAELRSRGIKP